MELPVEKWYKAAGKRRSCRRYFPQFLSQELVYHLWHVITELNEAHSGARIELRTDSPDPVLKGILGSYGKIQGARAYAAFIGDTRDPHMEEKLGYLGQCFILESTANRLGTCWVGGTFKADAVSRIVKAGPEEAVLAIATVGFPQEKQPTGGHKRKPLEKLYTGLPKEKWPNWVEAALETARLAPSAYNRQPWRFVIDPEGITLSIDSPKETRLSQRLDCGIAMLHVEIGALSRGVQGTWEYLPSPQVARFTVSQ
jgi:nitroreductase